MFMSCKNLLDTCGTPILTLRIPAETVGKDIVLFVTKLCIHMTAVSKNILMSQK